MLIVITQAVVFIVFIWLAQWKAYRKKHRLNLWFAVMLYVACAAMWVIDQGTENPIHPLTELDRFLRRWISSYQGAE
ncbi:hypothetical protein [Paenibacillus sp. YYML68]|uniref:hypothetical protein n=1 Tax=Paenibacillus sp. YYML68 TaxID=2909250 RepID=UPI002490EC8D|nr:hypothetical protein [Paenibacillus sp. YYML68]